MQSPNLIERRRTSRRDVDVLVESCTGAAGRSLRTRNLSLDGVRLDTALPVGKGMLVQMVMHVPGERGPMHVRGTVVDADDGTAVEFVRLTTRDRLQIAEYLFG